MHIHICGLKCDRQFSYTTYVYTYIRICTETHDTAVFIAPLFQLVIRKYILNTVQGVDTIIPAIEIFRTGISNSLHLVNIT